VLSDGDEYRLYNATAPVGAEEKLFRSVRLSSQGTEEVADTLSLISRSNMQQNIIDAVWEAHFVDRRVKEALRSLLTSRNKGLVRLIRVSAPKLTPKQVAESLRRLEIRIDSPVPKTHNATMPGSRPSSLDKKKKQRQAGLKAAQTRREYATVTLPDLLAAGALVAPQRLFRKYKGHPLEAVLQLGGEVEFQGTRYPSCSQAAAHARGVVVGQPMNTNGWEFWQITDGTGKKCTLDSIRRAFYASKMGR